MAKVSIIIPVYNVEQYLERCLETVINQTLKDIEIILVNDGSTDNSVDICNRYAQKDSRIKVVTRKNGGLSAARNTGLEHVSGEYIGFLDSDDWVDKDFYEKLYNAAIENDCDIAFGDIIRKGEHKHKIRLKIPEIIVAEDIYDKMQLAQNLKNPGVWNKIYRKHLFDNGLRFEEGVYYEDREFSIQIINECKKIVAVPNIYYYYFVNPTSIVKSRHTWKKTHDKCVTRIKMINYATRHGIKLPQNSVDGINFKIELPLFTLFVIKDTQFERKYYLFGSILVYKRKR
ncbi:MAG: glycosyltransferase [Candidatus Gastranaerophilaceae bacterium]